MLIFHTLFFVGMFLTIVLLANASVVYDLTDKRATRKLILAYGVATVFWPILWVYLLCFLVYYNLKGNKNG